MYLTTMTGLEVGWTSASVQVHVTMHLLFMKQSNLHHFRQCQQLVPWLHPYQAPAFIA